MIYQYSKVLTVLPLPIVLVTQRVSLSNYQTDALHSNKDQRSPHKFCELQAQL